MNYKIAKTMLGLCIIYLVVFYIIKFIFPTFLIQTITSPSLINLGISINKYKFLSIFIMLVCSYLTFYLFAFASSGRFKFSWYEFVIIGAFMLANYFVTIFLPELYTHTSTASMLIIALIVKGKLSYTAISFTIHGYLSQFLMSIRGFETVIVQIQQAGVLSSFVMCLEIYVWLLLLGIIFYFKENKIYGNNGTPLSQQEHKEP